MSKGVRCRFDSPWPPERPCLLVTRYSLLVFFSLLTACASFGRGEDSRGVTVAVRESRASAVRRTLRAFREQGYEVRESLTSGSEIVSEPFDAEGSTEAVFRATVVEGDGETRVRLTGTYRERVLGVFKTGEREVVRASEGREGALWARLQNLGLAIRSR